MGRKGRAVQIVTPKEDSFVLEERILNGILGKDELKGMKLYVLCVAGAFRKGKSFLLSLLIMYLESQVRYFSSSIMKVLIKVYICVYLADWIPTFGFLHNVGFRLQNKSLL